VDNFRAGIVPCPIEIGGMKLRRICGVVLLLLLACLPAFAGKGDKAFDGKTLSGWQLIGGHGRGYVVEEGTIVCPKDGGGNLYTEREYSDFLLKLEFKVAPGGNNGIGIRAPLEGDAAYVGMEVQVLDDDASEYANLEPGQYCGSIYKVAAASRGSLKKAGEWNKEEIRAVGRHITVTINGKKIVDADLNAVTSPVTLAQHPGILRQSGHIGFLGHGTDVRFRNISIKDLSKKKRPNKAPQGFVNLFNGKDISGWKGLVGNPMTRAQMSPDALALAEKTATEAALLHWKSVKGVLTYDGKNNSLCTVKQYADFELQVDWKIEPGGDSGIYLRGAPQVQIWDTARTDVGAQVGSGGLYNNQKNTSKPLVVADNPVGEWNRFIILMVGERVTIYLNNTLVVHDVPLENYWERGKPIYAMGSIELQHHNDPLFFKNIYIREIVKEIKEIKEIKEGNK
jgi:hypothetical protein